jgi:hypothetical protein
MKWTPFFRHAVKRHGESIEVAEWPGGEPIQLDLDVTSNVFAFQLKTSIVDSVGKEI